MSSYKQVLLYELARDLIHGKIAQLSCEIGEEERQPLPNFDRILDLEEQSLVLSREMDEVEPSNEVGVLALIHRNFGAECVERLLSGLDEFDSDSG